MATETVNVNATAITAAITAEAAARVAGDAASVATAASDATTKANAAQAAAISAAATDATTKANAAQAAAIAAAATDATTKANAAQAFAIQRANHTGTQLAATISDLAATVRALSASTVLTYTGGSVVNSTTTLSNIHSSAGFTISNAGEYEFEFYVTYDVGATSTGIQLSVSGTTTFSYLNTLVSYSVLSTDRSTTQFDAYDGGRPASSSATTTANGAIVKGSIIATAGGSLNLRFASEGAGLSVTITNVIGRLKMTA